MVRRLPLAIAITLVLGACAAGGADAPTSDDGTATPNPSASAAPRGPDADGVLVISSGAVASGPGITIPEALSGQAGDQPVLVNGALFIDPDGTVRLCDAMMESFPPQCGGASLVVEGLDLSGIPDLEDANGIRWAEAVQLFGTVEAAD
jgi:hypothetical protein